MKTNCLETDYLNIGEIYREHGIQGACKFYSYSSDDLNLDESKQYILQKQDGSESSARIQSVKTLGRYFLVKFDLFQTPEQIRDWRKAKLWIRKQDLNRNDVDLYDFEWEGFSMLDENNKAIGTIRSVQHIPLKNFIVITTRGESLVPYVEDWIVRIDKDNKTIAMKLPEGLV